MFIGTAKVSDWVSCWQSSKSFPHDSWLTVFRKDDKEELPAFFRGGDMRGKVRVLLVSLCNTRGSPAYREGVKVRPPPVAQAFLDLPIVSSFRRSISLAVRSRDTELLVEAEDETFSLVFGGV